MSFELGVRSKSSELEARSRKIIFPIIALLLVLIYGFYQLRTPNSALPAPSSQLTTNKSIKITVIQGNIPQEMKWQPETRDYIIDKYLAITRMAANSLPDLIVWPEAALPAVMAGEDTYYQQAASLCRAIRIPLLLGAVTVRGDLYYNSALLIRADGNLAGSYDKLHLVPFGEYIPLKKTFRFLETIVPIGDITPGREYTIFNLPAPKSQLPTPNSALSAKFGVLICFEDLFPELARGFVKNGADFLVNITNDGWYQRTAASYQHSQASVFRAVENRVFLVRSANTGISGFISPKGKIISLLCDSAGREIFIDGYDTQKITLTEKRLSFYNRYGDLFVVFCAFIMFCGIIIQYLNLKSKAPSHLSA